MFSRVKQALSCSLHPKIISILLCPVICFTAYGCGHQNKVFEIPTEKGTRDATPNCLIPDAPGVSVFSGEGYCIDFSNASEGYISASYTGSCPKNKFQLTLPDGTTYTYSLSDTMEVFPLSSDSGTYTVGIFENIQSNQYSTLFSDSFDVTITNPFGAYLYPNQYVDFQGDDETIELGRQLAYSANSDLDVVSNIYNYIITHITYDYEKADNVQSGYLPDIDETIATGTGICLDYAAVMSSMLRSQNIPTHLEVGYAGAAYHAWISTYIKDVGWINGIIQFDGQNWELMDPTFGSTTASKKLEKYLGDGSHYVTKFVY